jgi:pimeloyl-ACP methyl ester carboxylesterase/RimJ/RimL family protein N-acetyltransferase
MTIPHFIYLHGFASSPSSGKALFFKQKLAGWGIALYIPDLNTPDFSTLTLTSMIDRLNEVVQECGDGRVYIIASSLGSMVALHFLDRFKSNASRVEKMMFLAPSFDFARTYQRKLSDEELARWKSTGWLGIHHYSFDKQFRVHYGLIEDALKYDSYAVRFEQPLLIFHGLRDEEVDDKQSLAFAEGRKNVTVSLLDSDHLLQDQLNLIWATAVDYFDLCAIHSSKSNIRVQILDLSKSEDVDRFAQYEERFLDVLEEAYTDRFFAREVHIERIYSEKHVVFLAFVDGTATSDLIGCSYIRPDGKRSATAVSPNFQGRGIAKELVCASLRVFPDQFSEIYPSNERMRNLLASFGFHPVTSEAKLRAHLGRASLLIRSVHNQSGGAVYKRQSATHQDIEHEFILLEHPANRALRGRANWEAASNV